MSKMFYDIIPLKRLGWNKIKKTSASCLPIIKQSVLKIVTVLVILGLSWFGPSVFYQTLAYFSDTETSSENTFTTGTLVLSWSWHSGPDNFVPGPKAENMKPGDELTRVIQVINEGSLPFQYNAKTEKISGDDDLCNALQLEAKLEGRKKIDYEGDLMDFSFDPFELETAPGIDTWHLKLSLPEDVLDDLQDKLCEFNFVFEGWQLNSSNSSLGFSDTIEVMSFVKTSAWNLQDQNPPDAVDSITGNDEEEELPNKKLPIDDEGSETKVNEESISSGAGDNFKEETISGEEGDGSSGLEKNEIDKEDKLSGKEDDSQKEDNEDQEKEGSSYPQEEQDFDRKNGDLLINLGQGEDDDYENGNDACALNDDNEEENNIETESINNIENGDSNDKGKNEERKKGDEEMVDENNDKDEI